MRIQVKRLVGTKWKQVEIQELIGESICNFILKSKDGMIAALFNDSDDNPIALVSNDMKHLERYQGSGKLLLDAETLRELVGTEVMPSLIARIFPGSGLVGVEYGEPNESMPLVQGKES